MEKVLKSLVAALVVVALVACAAWAGVGFWLWPTLRRVDVASAALLDCTYRDASGKMRGNPACLVSRIDAITGAFMRVMGIAAKTMPELAKASVEASNNSVIASQKTVKAIDRVNGVLSNVDGAVTDGRAVLKDLGTTVQALHEAVVDMDGGVGALLKSSDETMRKAGDALAGLPALEKTLNGAIDVDGAGALDVLRKMFAILDDRNVAATLGNLNNATASGANILQTFDQATEPLRKKATLVKMILLKLWEMVKFTFHVAG